MPRHPDEIRPGPLTARQAAREIKRYLDGMQLEYTKVTAKTISFEGFGYGRKIFVTVHGWRHGQPWQQVVDCAKRWGVIAETGD